MCVDRHAALDHFVRLKAGSAAMNRWLVDSDLSQALALAEWFKLAVHLTIETGYQGVFAG
jgi:hypothetical protein